MKRVSWIRLILLASLIIVLILSLVSASSIPNFATFAYLTDKLIHGIIYFYLAMLIFFSKLEISIIKALTLLFIFGLFIEIIHYYHPYRYFELGDLLANFVGVFMCYLIIKKDNKFAWFIILWP